ncbi:MAG: hypothetical protein WKG01_41765 [Kofleriaceae bacterium]
MGEAPIGGIGNDAAGGGDGAGGDGNNQLACVDRNLTPGTAHDHGGGNTNAGVGCITAGCHLDGTGGPAFEMAGTVYQDNAGTIAATGVTLRVFPAGSTTPITSLSDTAGNFYFTQGQLLNAYPAKTETTACPSTKKMTAQLLTNSSTGGNCNKAGCHSAAGDAGGRITDR